MTLLETLNVMERTIIGRCMSRHRHDELLHFVKTIQAAVPADNSIHVILDNYCTHKRPNMRVALARHPHVFQFTPNSASWMNAAEGFLSALTSHRLKRGSFNGNFDIQVAI